MRWVLTGIALLVLLALGTSVLVHDAKGPLTTRNTTTTTSTTTEPPTSTTVTNTTNPFSDVEVTPGAVSTCGIPMIAHYEIHVVPLGDCAGLIGNLDVAPISVPVGSIIRINGSREGGYFGSDADGPFYGPFVSSDPAIADVTSQTTNEVTIVAQAVGTVRLAASTQFSCIGGPSSDCTVTMIAVTP